MRSARRCGARSDTLRRTRARLRLRSQTSDNVLTHPSWFILLMRIGLSGQLLGLRSYFRHTFEERSNSRPARERPIESASAKIRWELPCRWELNRVALSRVERALLPCFFTVIFD